MKKYISILLIVIFMFSFASCSSQEDDVDMLTKIKDINKSVSSYQISLNITSTKNSNESNSSYVPMTIHGNLQQNNKSFTCSLSINENNLYQYGDHKNDIFFNKKINGDFNNDSVSMEIQTEQGDVLSEKSKSQNEKIYIQFLSAINNDAIVEKENDCYKIQVKQADFKNAFKDCDEIAFNTIKEYLGTITNPDSRKDIEYIFDENLFLKKININSLETRNEEFKCLSNIEISFDKHNEKFEVKKETLKVKDSQRIISEEENFFFENLHFFLFAISENDNIKKSIPQITLGKKIDLKDKEGLIHFLKQSECTSAIDSAVGIICEYDIDGTILNITSNNSNIDMEVLINDKTDKEFSINEFKLGSTKKDDVIKKYSNKMSTVGDKTIIEIALDSIEGFESNLKLYFNKDNVLYGFRLYMHTN